ncbi:lycopene beta-cyclase CrtY [uncultured Caulobacter sp.]|uniref:lycopene beta-cyclase CrtY n=1 Tax=uncultured Caulobacter sp. TaxID=158749 RepID=UPI00262C608D|nr:lycopene beta-cyclase CrtY [uncultured Caulobacter sp.]
MSPSSAFARADVVLVGGGLANGLIALRLRAMRPDLKVLLLERDRRIGGERSWRWFETDLAPGLAAWLRPLVTHRWSGWEAGPAGAERYFETPCFALTGERLSQALATALGANLWLGVEVTEIAPHQVTLADGRRIAAAAVIDGRGPRNTRSLALRWRVSLAQAVTLDAAHGLSCPVLVDAVEAGDPACPAFTVLPLGPRRLRIEHARYAATPVIDPAPFRAAIGRYARARGWTIEQAASEDADALPIALGGDIDAYWREARPEVAKVGPRAAIFHPGTGHALPDAARLADQIAALPRITSASVRAVAETYSKTAWRRRRFHRLLNRLLFVACPPEARPQVAARFHRLPPSLIHRFHAARLTLWDKARILAAPSPIPLAEAFEQIPDRAAPPRTER